MQLAVQTAQVERSYKSGNWLSFLAIVLVSEYDSSRQRNQIKPSFTVWFYLIILLTKLYPGNAHDDGGYSVSAVRVRQFR